jgi:hypothetical protein
MDQMRTALGFRVHSGWAAMVAAAGAVDDPYVVERRRIVIADAAMVGSKQPYHAAAELPPDEAEAFVRTAVESARMLAGAAIADAVERLRLEGCKVVACAVLTAAGRSLPDLAGILASHALIHTAEGEMFREAAAWGARECGLPVRSIREKDIDAERLRRVQHLGKVLGPPWTSDQKLATVAALLALEAAG